ncbi:hypothetical protein LOK49_LG09G01219 [Camellia lanceoleosa]|uniref:Uncharacterized protein n=1 Tax=Camellia lanceoleosa TaxID=1840588 RepID=A0ACC0GKD2_9ERIC|nr:hypothetical protein LOK49_LG09G01219 [Camellia lanceoleosa]
MLNVDKISRDELYEYWSQITDQSFDSQLQIFFDINDFDDDEQYRENPSSSSSSLSRRASLVERKSLLPAVAASTRMSSALIRRLGIGRSRLRSRDFKNMSIFATIDKNLCEILVEHSGNLINSQL